MNLVKPFKHFDTYAHFLTKKISANSSNTMYRVNNGAFQTGTPEILWEHFVLIHDIGQIWNRGRFYNYQTSYASLAKIAKKTFEPYETPINPSATGKYELKAVVTCTDGSTYERYSEITVANPRSPFKNTPAVLPGKVEAENFDCGPEGISFHDANSNKQGTGASYRTDITGIDVEKGGTGYTVGYTQVGEWMEYTVDVQKDGYYSYDIM